MPRWPWRGRGPGRPETIQAGGGIVADSDPEDEFQETVNKAMALLRASEMASRGSVVPSQSAINGLLEGVDPSFLESQR